MMKLKEVLREYLSKNVFQPLHFPPKALKKTYNILVVDEIAMKIMSSCFKMNQIFEEGITVVEDISKIREPFPTLDAIYIIVPTWDSIRSLISDFTKLKNSKCCLYKSSHVFFLRACPDDMFEELSKSAASKFIRTLKEINLNFIAHENRIFQIPRRKLNNNNSLDDEIHQLADGIASVCALMGVYPLLRYYSDFAHSAEICYRVEQKLDEIMRFDKSLGIESDAELIILDRSFDLCTPLLHDLNFQGMAADLLNFENGIFEYCNDEGAVKKAMFDEDDEMWMELRHNHIARVMNRIAEVTKHEESNKPSTSSSIREIGSTIHRLPAHLRKINQLSAYINLAEECMRKFKEDSLNELCVLEQDIITGYTVKGVPIRDILITQRIAKMPSFKISPESRLRMLLIYMTAMPEKSEEFYIKMLEILGLEEAEYEYIVRKMNAWMKKSLDYRAPRKNWKTYEEKFVTARWIPRIGDVIKSAVARTLDESKFLLLGRKPPRMIENPATSVRFGKSEEERNEGTNKRKIIIFVNGGITYSEMRLAYEMSKEMKNAEIFVGSDKILTPNKYIESLRDDL